MRTEGQAAAETGLRVARLALYPDQVRILNDPNSPCVYLHAPPGCGKTVMLVLKALQWLREGHHVHLMALSQPAFAVSAVVEMQIRHTLAAAAALNAGALVRHVFKYWKLNSANIGKLEAEIQQSINTLKATRSQDGCAYVIIDEADADTG